MKKTKAIAGMTILALGVAGGGRLYAETHKTEADAQAQMTQEVVSGSAADRQVELSERGLSAMNDIHLARLALNDGYVDKAKDLLGEAKDLLQRVKSEDRPASHEPGKQAGTDSQATGDDMIPILSELQVVESYAVDAAAPGADQAAEQTASKTGKAAPSEDAKAARAKDRSDAVAKANEHLSKGDREAAAAALRLVDLALVDQTLSMPLSETTESVDQALRFIKKDELYEANLELKKARDALAVTTHVVAAPIGKDDSAKAPEPAKSAG